MMDLQIGYKGNVIIFNSNTLIIKELKEYVSP